MELLAWERLSDHIQSRVPVLLPMGGSRGAVVGYEPQAQRLFVRLVSEAGPLTAASPYAELHVEARQEGGKPVMEVFTTAPHLFKEFHRFAGLLTEEYERPSLTAADAFSAVVERWRELTLRRDLLSADEQIGLAGELAVLAALAGKEGPQSIAAWTGRIPGGPERHDFRIGTVDLEVKSTRSSKRQHVIHGLRQLEPSAGHTLFVVSLRFESAGLGSGLALGERVSQVRELLRVRPASAREFEEKLVAARYDDRDQPHYDERTILADTPMLIPVDDAFPRLVPASLRVALGDHLAARIAYDVTYRIDVEGLGTAVTSSQRAMSLGLSRMD